jgi:hypothetical protein
MELHQESGPRGRAMDRSNQDARKAVSIVLERFTPWRLAIARMTGRAGMSTLSPRDLATMAEACSMIAKGIAEARTDLIIELADAPLKVTSHSRVVDAERALDNVESALADLRQLIASTH